MRTTGAVLLCGLLLVSACRRAEEPPPVELPGIDSLDLLRAALSADDLGPGWEPDENPVPNTIQIAGEVGARNVTNPVSEATTAFHRNDGPGIVSNSIFLVGSNEIAEAVIEAHRQVADQKDWAQDREDGGTAVFSNAGAVSGLGRLGDEAFTARLDVTITAGEGEATDHAVDYVVFREGPIVSFVVAQDAEAAPFASKHADRLAELLADATPEP